MIHYLIDGQIANVKLDTNPENSIELLHMERICQIFLDISKQPNLSCVVLSSNRKDFFCNGFNIPKLSGYIEKSKDRKKFLSILQKTVKLIRNCPIPIIAKIEGNAVGYGAILMACCDFRIMSEGKYRIGFIETAIGLHVPLFVLDVVQDIFTSSARTMQHLLLSTMFKPQEALNEQIIDQLVSPQEINQKLQLLIKKLSRNSLKAIKSTKWALRILQKRKIKKNIIQKGNALLEKDFRSDEFQNAIQNAKKRME